MRVFFVSRDFSGASLAKRLLLEGHEVRAYVENPACEAIMRGLIGRMPSLSDGVEWVGRDGLVVVDDIGFGSWQDQLRLDGFAVVGGSALGDELEHNRSWAMDTLKACGVPTLTTLHFDNYEEAAEHIQNNPRAWVIKFDGHSPKAATFVGRLPCGTDAADFLKTCQSANAAEYSHNCGVVLQHAVSGQSHEIGVGRYFNGYTWSGPVELNIEYKRLCNSDLGPNTTEMGTLLWYEKDHPLFRRLLEPLTEILAQARHVGDVAVNCLINEHEIFPLEFTTRFGWPATQAQIALNRSPWGEFLNNLAHGRDADLLWSRGYAIALLLAVPPFPFASSADSRGSSLRGMPIRFLHPLTPAEEANIHYESVEFLPCPQGMLPVLCDDSGYALHVTGCGRTIRKARANTYELAKAAVLPGVFYRTDIGESAEQKVRFLKRILRPNGVGCGIACKPSHSDPSALLLAASQAEGVEIVRTFSEQSLADILALEHACFPASWHYEDAGQYYEDALRDAATVHVFLREAGTPIGYLLARPLTDGHVDLAPHDPELAKDPACCYIETAAIHPDFAGKRGLSRLTRALEQELAARPNCCLKRISCHARVSNRAHQLFCQSFAQHSLLEQRPLASWHFGGGEPYEYLKWELGTAATGPTN